MNASELHELMKNPQYQPLFALVKGFRNGVVYGKSTFPMQKRQQNIIFDGFE